MANLNLNVDVKVHGADRLRSLGGSLASGAVNVAKYAAAGVAALSGFGAVTANFASDLNESLSKVDVVFGDNADEIKAWAKTSSQAFGQSQQQALEAAGTYGNLFQAFGIAQEEATGMSTSLVELAADLASFNNTSVDDALVALRSGLSGETEPLKRFGIAINDARMRTELLKLGFKKLPATLTPAMKAQAAYSLIMKDSTLAQGDFERTSDGMANQQRILAADMQSVELGVDTPTIEVTNFCGTYTLPDDITESATFGVAVTEDTDTNWAALVGVTVEARVKDRATDTRYRKFTTMILINPSLYGPTEPGEARAFEFDVPVLSSPEWVTEGSS